MKITKFDIQMYDRNLDELNTKIYNSSKKKDSESIEKYQQEFIEEVKRDYGIIISSLGG